MAIYLLTYLFTELAVMLCDDLSLIWRLAEWVDGVSSALQQYRRRRAANLH